MILQSDNGREFANRIIKNLAEMWPGLKLVHGKPRHSQSQGSVERSNQDVREMLVTWMSDENTTKWSQSLRFVQSNKNRSLRTGIGTSPYEAMFGTPQKIGLKDSSVPKKLLSDIETEEELQNLVDQSGSNERKDEFLLLAKNYEIKENVKEKKFPKAMYVQRVTCLFTPTAERLAKKMGQMNKTSHITGVYELRK